MISCMDTPRPPGVDNSISRNSASSSSASSTAPVMNSDVTGSIIPSIFTLRISAVGRGNCKQEDQKMHPSHLGLMLAQTEGRR